MLFDRVPIGFNCKCGRWVPSFASVCVQCGMEYEPQVPSMMDEIHDMFNEYSNRAAEIELALENRRSYEQTKDRDRRRFATASQKKRWQTLHANWVTLAQSSGLCTFCGHVRGDDGSMRHCKSHRLMYNKYMREFTKRDNYKQWRNAHAKAARLTAKTSGLCISGCGRARRTVSMKRNKTPTMCQPCADKLRQRGKERRDKIRSSGHLLPETLWKRQQLGWDKEKILTTPVRASHKSPPNPTTDPA